MIIEKSLLLISSLGSSIINWHLLLQYDSSLLFSICCRVIVCAWWDSLQWEEKHWVSRLQNLHTDGHICGIANFGWISLHTFQRIPWLIPFAFTDDLKFSWLKKVFQQYSEDCLVCIRQQDDIFSKADKIKYLYRRKQIKE